MSIYEYVLRNTNLPKQDVKRIAVDARINGWTKEQALEKAKALYVK